MRFHVLSLPHTHTTADFSACAYTQKVRKLSRMLVELGHTVYLYAGERNDAPCTEHVICVDEETRAGAVAGGPYVYASFDPAKPQWQVYNARAIEAIRARARPRDFILATAGFPHQAVAEAFPDMVSVESGIGYGGTFARFRVWESYAWMHTVYGAHARDAHAVNGEWFDEVIPNSFDPAEFPFLEEKGPHFLYIGRLTARKGPHIAAQVCKALGVPLIVAGPGEPLDYGEHVGVVGVEERGRLMATARAVFAPTLYAEPFGGVAVEAQMCGTPAITTDWGAYPETVRHGVTGFRCRMFREFLDAARNAHTLDPATIRKHAVDGYSLEVIGRRYQAYFERLETLWGDGWYSA